jgi:methionine synthase II (cobalamin-independent)
MIERDIKTIKASHQKTAKSIKSIESWQVAHQKTDDANMGKIDAHFAALPTEQTITDAIAKTIQVVVNGKIDKVNASNDEIKAHLTAQDAALAELSTKVRPFDNAKTWAYDLFKICVGLGTFCGAAYAFIELLKLLNWIH